tara:strand:+ start:102 stop:590 length:489 start_codon:yes stop_codon:yes gene_type:complete
MTAEKDLYYEIEDSGNYIRIGINGLNFPNAKFDWDRNWINTLIEVKAGAFSGSFNAELITTDFEKYKNNLEIIYDNLNEKVEFKTIEGQIKIDIKGDGFGHFSAVCQLIDKVGIGNKLEFDLNFDQTQIPKMIRQLEKIIEIYPATGEFKNSIGKNTGASNL